MAELMVPEDSLSDDWRAQIADLGRQHFEIREMLRLGFLGPEDVGLDAEKEKSLAVAAQTLQEGKAELREIDASLARLGDVEEAIRRARTRRIERVRAASEIRKAERAAAKLVRAEEICERRRTQPTFLGRGVSERLQFGGSDRQRLEQLGLAVLDEFVDVAEALSLTPERLQWLVYERGASEVDHYSRFEIPKRSGGARLISSPKPVLREAQAWVRQNILSPLPVHSAAMAFRPGLSIVDNAKVHAGAATIIRIDLKDFFPGISFRRVRDFFEAQGYNPGVATVLALICTDAPRVRLTMDGRTSIVAVGERALPQGACTSPDLANLISGRLDRRLSALAQRSGWAYTRYADDLVFSSSADDASSHRLIRAVNAITASEGFVVNASKTRVMRSPGRQAVTGLVVNNGVTMSRRDQRRIRAFFHQCEVQGFDAVSLRIGKNAEAVARGYYAYMHMVSPSLAAALRQKHPLLLGGVASATPQVRETSGIPEEPAALVSPVTTEAPPTPTSVEDETPRYFEYIGENREMKSGESRKFWEVSVDGSTVITRYGRIGAKGQTTILDAGSADAARARVEKLVAEKTRKGYREMPGAER